MSSLPKICLAVSAAGFLGGGIIDFAGFNTIPAVLVVVPLGAVFFGMSMIALIMEKEMAAFDEETTGKLQLIKPGSAVATPQNQPGFDQSRIVSQTASRTVNDH